MPTVIAVTEAKANLSEILDRVRNGEEFVITRHGKMIAKLVPITTISLNDVRQSAQQLKELRKGVNASVDEMIAWKNEGRR